MDNLDTLSIFTKALLDRGMDYDVTLKGSSVTVRLFESMTEVDVGSSTHTSLEAALAAILAEVASRPTVQFSINN